MENSRKGLVISLLIIIIVLVVGGGAYLFFKNSQPILESSTQEQLPVVDKNTSVTPLGFIFPRGGETFPLNLTTPEVHKISWTPFSLGKDESLFFTLSKIGTGIEYNIYAGEREGQRIKNIDVKNGTADWVLDDVIIEDYGGLDYQYNLTIQKIKHMPSIPPDCGGDEFCPPDGDPNNAIILEIISKPFYISGPFS